MRSQKELSYFLKFSFIVSAFLISLIFVRYSGAYGFYNWYTQGVGYDLASMKEEDTGYPLILYFYVEQDEWSKKMTNEYLADETVDDFLLDIPKVAIDINYSFEEQRMAEKYGIDRCPAFLISIPSLKTKIQRIHPYSEKGNMSINEFIEKIKEYITYHYNINAQQLFEKKEYDKSLELFDKSLKFDPDNAYTYHAIAIVYHTMGADSNDSDILKSAEEYYQKALKLDPDNEEIKKELEKLTKDKK